MAESPAHRLNLHVGGNSGSGSFGMCCSYLTPFALAHPPHIPALQPWQKVLLTDSISASAASIGSARSLAPVLSVCAVPISPFARKISGSGSFGMCGSYLTLFALAHSPPSCTTTMAESPAHRLDLHLGGKYRLGKKIGSDSFGMYCSYLTTFALAHLAHHPALQP